MNRAAPVLALALLALVFALPARAETPGPEIERAEVEGGEPEGLPIDEGATDDGGVNVTPDWRAEKCARFERAWNAVIDGQGARMSAGFVEGVDAFVTSHCEDRQDICPAPGADFEAADMLALMVVSEGMTTSFLPFGCS